MRANSLRARQAKAKGDYNAFTPARMLFAKIRRGYYSEWDCRQFDKHLWALLWQMEGNKLPKEKKLQVILFLLRVLGAVD